MPLLHRLLTIIALVALLGGVACSAAEPTPAPKPNVPAPASPPAAAKPAAQASPTAVAGRPPTQTANPGPPAFDRNQLQYGFQAHLFGVDVARVVQLTREAGFGWLKQQVRWADVEPAKGQYNWTELDQVVDGVTTRGGVNLLFSVVAAPGWATGNNPVSGPPKDPNDLARFVGALAERYKGRVRAYEIWNEENLWYEWGGKGKLNAAAYVKLLRASYQAIKRVDPDAVVVAGALTPTGIDDGVTAIDDVRYLEQMYQAGLKDVSDAVGAHPGGYNNPPDDWVNKKTVKSNDFKEHPSFYFRRIEQYREVMVKSGDPQKKVWITEFGYSTLNKAPGYEYGKDVTPQLQAEWLTRAVQKTKTEYPWVGAIFIWNLNFSAVTPNTDEKYPFSVLNPDYSPRPAYTALKNMPK